MKLISLRQFGEKKVLFKDDIKIIRKELEQKTADCFLQFTRARTLSWHKAKNILLD